MNTKLTAIIERNENETPLDSPSGTVDLKGAYALAREMPVSHWRTMLAERDAERDASDSAPELTLTHPMKALSHPLTLRVKADTAVAVLARLQASRSATELKLKPSELRSYSVGGVTIDLPFGLPRYINAATLKALVRARPRDLLFRKAAQGWEICSDSQVIDVQDNTAVFRIGKVEILS